MERWYLMTLLREISLVRGSINPKMRADLRSLKKNNNDTYDFREEEKKAYIPLSTQ